MTSSFLQGQVQRLLSQARADHLDAIELSSKIRNRPISL